MLYKIDHIRDDILDHVENKQPFSLVRVGDGDLKLLVELLNDKVNPVKFNRSGIPNDKGKEILRIYRNACNSANYTSSFEMYYTKEFWGRKFSSGTKKKVKGWRKIYKNVKIANTNFCNPESGHLLFLDDVDLLNNLKGKKICLITCFKRLGKLLRKKGFDADVIEIPGLYSGHFTKHRKILNKITQRVEEIDIFLIGAGALGKAYSNGIKKSGGVAVDVGQVLNAWSGENIAGRFRGILTLNRKTLLFSLTSRAKKFRQYI